MRTETGLVVERRGKAVPRDKGTTVNTSNLVIGQDIALVHGLECLHTQQEQVPLVGIAGQVADLHTDSRLPAGTVASTVGGGAWGASSHDGNASGITLGKLFGDLVNLGVHSSIYTAGVAVAGAILECCGELGKGEERDEHAQHARGLAEVCHDERGRTLWRKTSKNERVYAE